MKGRPLKCKVFSLISTAEKAASGMLERNVNAFLEQNQGIEILSQSSTCCSYIKNGQARDVMICTQVTIIYKEPKAQEESNAKK